MVGQRKVIENQIAMFSMLVYHYSFFNPRHYKLLLVISGEKNDRKKNTLLVLSKLINGVEKLEKIYE